MLDEYYIHKTIKNEFDRYLDPVVHGAGFGQVQLVGTIVQEAQRHNHSERVLGHDSGHSGPSLDRRHVLYHAPRRAAHVGGPRKQGGRLVVFPRAQNIRLLFMD